MVCPDYSVPSRALLPDCTWEVTRSLEDFSTQSTTWLITLEQLRPGKGRMTVSIQMFPFQTINYFTWITDCWNYYKYIFPIRRWLFLTDFHHLFTANVIKGKIREEIHDYLHFNSCQSGFWSNFPYPHDPSASTEFGEVKQDMWIVCSFLFTTHILHIEIIVITKNTLT